MSVQSVQILEGHSGRVWNCSWNPKGNLLASCGEDTNIRIWGKDSERWTCKAILADSHTRLVHVSSFENNIKLAYETLKQVELLSKH